MGDALLQRVLQAVGQPDHQGERLGRRETAPDPEKIAKVRPFDKFHDHIEFFIALAIFVDPDDVRVDQAESGLGLLVEASDGPGVGDESIAKDLDGDRLVAVDLPTAIDASEGAFGDVEENLEAAEMEAREVAFLELLDLPGREEVAPKQDSGDCLDASVSRINPGFHGLIASDQADQGRLFEKSLSINLCHGRDILDCPNEAPRQARSKNFAHSSCYQV